MTRCAAAAAGMAAAVIVAVLAGLTGRAWLAGRYLRRYC